MAGAHNGLAMESEDTAPTAEKITICEVCNVAEAKYTCPKCSVRTCCLACVNIHKKELPCDGIRDRTKFLYPKEFNNMDLLNDYKLLEESSRFVYNKKKDPAKRYTSFNKDLTHQYYKLKFAARKRGTLLLYLLDNFTRHKNNTSRLNFKLNKIFWRIEWVFVNAHPNTTKYIDPKCDEDLRVANLLDKYFSPDPSQESLEYYCSVGLSGCRLLLQAERVKDCSKKFHELDVRLSLKENLAGKCIIDFPIIFVVLKDHSYGLNIINSDDEDDVEIEKNNSESMSEKINGQNDIDEIGQSEKPVSRIKETFTTMVARQKKLQIENEIAEVQKKKPKNYLFTTGYSSDEEN